MRPLALRVVPALCVLGLPLCSLSLCSLSLCGCGHKDTVVGKWEGDIRPPGSPRTLHATYEFTPDGKENIDLQSTAGPISMRMGVNGTYTIQGSALTQTITSMTMGDKTIPVPAGKSQSQTSTFHLDGDHLTVTNPTNQETLTLTRVKP